MTLDITFMLTLITFWIIAFAKFKKKLYQDDCHYLAGEHLGILLQVPLLQVIGKPSVSTLSDEVVMDDHYNLRKDNIDNHTPKKLIICPKMLTTMSYEVVMDDYNDLRKDNIIIHAPKN